MIAQSATQSYVISVWQFLAALVVGCRVEIIPERVLVWRCAHSGTCKAGISDIHKAVSAWIVHDGATPEALVRGNLGARSTPSVPRGLPRHCSHPSLRTTRPGMSFRGLIAGPRPFANYPALDALL